MARPREFRLSWALALALLVHAVALAAASRLPLLRAAGQETGRIQVFDAAAPVVVAPVSVIEFNAPARPMTPREVVAKIEPQPPVAIAAAPDVVVRPRPEARRPVTPSRVSAPGATGATRRAAGRPGGGDARLPSPPAAGGGGAPISAGPPSEVGSVPLPVGGGTPGGEVPGEGAGQGAGAGRGHGPGSGEGSGGGHGSQPAGDGSGNGGGKTGGEGAPFVSRQADRAEPQLVSKGKLAYPPAAAADGAEGTCVLKVLVGEKGEVLDVTVTTSSGDRRLDQAAQEYVRHWQYRPAVQNGQPRRVSTRATVEFALD